VVGLTSVTPTTITPKIYARSHKRQRGAAVFPLLGGR
jgi:hypothetical protein